jgi:hypothetical protein
MLPCNISILLLNGALFTKIMTKKRQILEVAVQGPEEF